MPAALPGLESELGSYGQACSPRLLAVGHLLLTTSGDRGGKASVIVPRPLPLPPPGHFLHM